MSMSELEISTTDKGMLAAKKLLDEVKPIVDQLNVIYDGANGVKSTLTDEKLASVPSYSNITKAQMDDGMFAITSTLRTALSDAATQLAILAARK